MSIVISLCSLALLTTVLVVLCINKRRFSSKTMAWAGITIATSFALSFIKFSPVQYGGSVTLFSMLPLCIFSYVFGFFPALLVGLIYGVLQFIQSPYIFTPLTVILDFLLAFSSVSLASISKKISSGKYSLLLGVIFVYAVRFIFHFFSGVIYFYGGGIWANLPSDNAFIYSLLYQAVYLIPDLIICLTGAFIAVKTKLITAIEKTAN